MCVMFDFQERRDEMRIYSQGSSDLLGLLPPFSKWLVQVVQENLTAFELKLGGSDCQEVNEFELPVFWLGGQAVHEMNGIRSPDSTLGCSAIIL